MKLLKSTLILLLTASFAGMTFFLFSDNESQKKYGYILMLVLLIGVLALRQLDQKNVQQ